MQNDRSRRNREESVEEFRTQNVRENRPIPIPTRREMREHEEVKKRNKNRRKKRIILWSSVVATLGLIAGGGFLALHNLQSNVTQISSKPYLDPNDRPTKAAPVENPEDPFSGALNILVIGSDVRDPEDNSEAEGMRSDTVMIAHVSEDRERLEVVSIPRDSWVDIPSCTLPDGSVTQPQTSKFNAAFSLGGQTGDTGAAVACTTKTIEQLTGVYIDDYVVVDFNGFKGLVDSLGGVEFNVEEPIIDPGFSNTYIEAGPQTFDGETALRYARVRKAEGMDGSDISRIGRQQELIAAIIDKAKTKVTDPTAMYSFASSALEMVTTSPDLGNMGNMAGLAWSVKGVAQDDIVFKTVPVVDRGDGSNVLWTDEATMLWDALIHDEPISGKAFKDGDQMDVESPEPTGSASPSNSPEPSPSSEPTDSSWSTDPSSPSTEDDSASSYDPYDTEGGGYDDSWEGVYPTDEPTSSTW